MHSTVAPAPVAPLSVAETAVSMPLPMCPRCHSDGPWQRVANPTAGSEFRSLGVDAAWLAQAQEERARAAAPGQKRPGQS